MKTDQTKPTDESKELTSFKRHLKCNKTADAICHEKSSPDLHEKTLNRLVTLAAAIIQAKPDLVTQIYEGDPRGSDDALGEIDSVAFQILKRLEESSVDIAHTRDEHGFLS